MKKISLLMIAAVMSVSVFAEEFVYDNMRYEINGNHATLLGPKSGYTPSGTLTIPIGAIKGTSTSYTVTKVKANAFQNQKSITAVVFSSSSYIEEIGQSAFEGCTNLKTLTFSGSGNDKLVIKAYAFQNCSTLTTVTFPTYMAYIYNSAFKNCVGLKSLTFKTIQSIHGDAFMYCSNLAEVTWSSTYENLYVYTGTWTNESNASLATWSPFEAIKSTLQKITFTGKYAPSYICKGVTGLKTVSFSSSSVNTIGEKAFMGCTNLNEVDWFKNVMNGKLYEIKADAFNGCTNLMKNSTLYLQCSILTKIGASAFYGTGMENLIIDTERFTSIDDEAFAYCPNLSKITWKTTMGAVRSTAFRGDSKVTKVVISMPNKSYQSAFDATHSPFQTTYLSALNSVEINMKGVIPSNILNGASKVEYLTIGTSVTGVSDEAFAGCSSIYTVYWNAPEATIEHYNVNTSLHSPFQAAASKLNVISFGNSVTKIPACICNGMVKMQGVAIPASVMDIDSRAFYNCLNMSNILCWATNPPSLGYDVFTNCNQYNDTEGKGLKSINLIVPVDSKELYKNADGWKEFFDDEGIEEVMANEAAKDGKYMIDGQVYILRGGKIFDMQGKEVK